MKTVNELRDALLNGKEPPEKALQLADKYLQQLAAMGDDFRLPREHLTIKPLLEEFGTDPEGFHEFVRSVRDAVPSRSMARKGLQELFRTIETRLTQQMRRVRLDAAITMAVKKSIIPDVYSSKLAYANRCTAFWAQRKKNLLDAHRAMKDHLDTDTRRVLLDEFWAKVDAEIANGELPKP